MICPPGAVRNAIELARLAEPLGVVSSVEEYRRAVREPVIRPADRAPSGTSSSCFSASAAMTISRCSSKSTPSSSAPWRSSSRLTAAAKLGCLSFFLTDFGVMPCRRSGRT